MTMDRTRSTFVRRCWHAFVALIALSAALGCSRPSEPEGTPSPQKPEGDTARAVEAAAPESTGPASEPTAQESAPAGGAATVEDEQPQAAATPSADPPGPAPAGMVWIPPGTFEMGSRDGFVDEQPVHPVTLSGFWIDETEVTNAKYAEFVAASGYVTVAERTPQAEDFPGAAPEVLVPGSLVFVGPGDREEIYNVHELWAYVPGADWRHPLGPDSSIEGKMDHPVVQVAWEDAVAYADWAGKALPTEAQWEYAARGGLVQNRYAWGDEYKKADRGFPNNIWQGEFPFTNDGADGFVRTAPVKSFSPNGYGLYEVSGNVWEWCADWYRPDTYRRGPVRDPIGPPSGYDPERPGELMRVMRGGSYLCNDVYCTGYRVSARMKTSPDTGLCHVGFRCVVVPAAGEGQ